MPKEIKTMKVALYCRVSTSDQNNQNQELRLIDYAEQNNYQY
jgi:DNA invertase Pin-like site-specific DNA recombinase